MVYLFKGGKDKTRFSGLAECFLERGNDAAASEKEVK